jgi:hypothetical protein
LNIHWRQSTILTKIVNTASILSLFMVEFCDLVKINK